MLIPNQTIRSLILFVTVLLSAMPVATLAAGVASINNDLQAADNYRVQGDNSKALYYYQVVLSQDENNTEALYAIADIEFSKRKYKSAITRLNKILANDAYDAKALFLRGRIYSQQKNWKKALADLEMAEQLDDHNPDIHITLDYVYSAMGDSTKAQQSFENYQRINAQSAKQ